VAVEMRLWSHLEDGELYDQKSPNSSQYLRITGRCSNDAQRKPDLMRIEYKYHRNLPSYIPESTPKRTTQPPTEEEERESRSVKAAQRTDFEH
jgi:hypothetical protein